MTFNNSFSKSEFLQNNWQKMPVIIKNAFTFNAENISGEDLAGLACEEFVESRLIFANETQQEWTCEHGHFPETRFQNLPEKNWTLLVQNVDDFIDKVNDLKVAFDFLPKWRLDDVMFSYATTGGGVGPHFDYYDVFLIQTSGSREWKIGQHCDSKTPLQTHPDLKLLESFKEQESHTLNEGDMIYIPAGVAHWGTALSNDCITASIGFRAPAYSDLLAASINAIAENLSQDQRYRDSDIHDDKYLIAESIKQQFTEIFDNLDKKQLLEELTHQFSLQVTEMRHPDLLETDTEAVSSEPLDYRLLQQHPSSRFAYRVNNETATLYVNGEAFSTDLPSAIAICHSNFTSTNDKELLIELLNSGALITI